MNLGPQIFTGEGNKKKGKPSFNGISKYLLLRSRPCPQGDIWRKEGGGGQKKNERKPTFPLLSSLERH